MPSRRTKKIKQRHQALFLFSGTFGILLFSGLVMIFIALFGNTDTPWKIFDEQVALPSLAESTECILDKVIDGDTVVAICDGQVSRIRLSGIDAPEMGQKPWGQISKAMLQENLPSQFRLQNHGYDVYQRVLGTLYSNNEDINLRMIELGAAVIYRAQNTPQIYLDMQRVAKSAEIGIWSQPGSQQNPKLWRRYHL